MEKGVLRPLCPLMGRPCAGLSCALAVGVVPDGEDGPTCWRCGLAQYRGGDAFSIIDREPDTGED